MFGIDQTSFDKGCAEPSVDRPIREFTESLTVTDVHARISELVDAGLDQQLVVMGAVAFVEGRLAEWADPGAVEFARQERTELIEYFESLRTQPEDTTRRLPMSDGEIDHTIAGLPLESPEAAEAYRQDAEHALAMFRAERQRFFSPVYWQLSHERRRKRLAESWGERRRPGGPGDEDLWRSV